MHTFGVHRDIHEEGDVDEPVKPPWPAAAAPKSPENDIPNPPSPG